MGPTYKLENRRYTGSKTKLTKWIIDLIREECSGESFADLFAGTGIISASVSEFFNEIILNDFLTSNYVIYKAFFEKGEWDKEKIDLLIKKYNALFPTKLKENFFSINFGGKYFGKNDSKQIGYIREDIEKKKMILTDKEYVLLLASLIYSTDRIANTVGHYDAYIKKKPSDNRFVMGKIQPLDIGRINLFKKDANLLVKQIKADVVYIDPPYNSRQYSRFYHILETLIKWDKPKLYGTALKPKTPLENTSEYCKKNAPEVFQDLIDNLDCKHIVVSYNNTYKSKSHSSKNKITLKEIEMILKEKGETKIYRKSHRYFSCGKTEFNNHQELVFITKVR